MHRPQEEFIPEFIKQQRDSRSCPNTLSGIRITSAFEYAGKVYGLAVALPCGYDTPATVQVCLTLTELELAHTDLGFLISAHKDALSRLERGEMLRNPVRMVNTGDPVAVE